MSEQHNAAAAAKFNSSTTTTSLAALKSDDVSKEQLLEVIQKMNRKVKASSMVCKQLTEKLEKSESMKEKLLNLLQEKVLSGIACKLPAEEDQVVPYLQNAWHKIEEQQKEMFDEVVTHNTD